MFMKIKGLNKSAKMKICSAGNRPLATYATATMCLTIKDEETL